jgi:hypothetical protein
MRVGDECAIDVMGHLLRDAARVYQKSTTA